MHYNGVPTSGVYVESVKKEAQYQIFEELLRQICIAIGGNAELARAFMDNPSDRDIYLKWIASSAPLPPLTNMSVVGLWVFLQSAQYPELRRAAEMVKTAVYDLQKRQPAVALTSTASKIHS